MFAEKLEVSIRTIRRDVDALSRAGVPIYAVQGAGGGIRVMEGFALSRTLLDSEDRKVLMAVLGSLSRTPGVGTERVLDKLGALFGGREQEEWLRVDLDGWGRWRQSRLFEVFRSAIHQCRLVQFAYIDDNGNEQVRILEPMTMLYRGSAWYVWGWCRVREAFRTFRLSRVVSLQPMDETFQRRTGRLGEVGTSEPPAEIPGIHLRFSPSARRRVWDDFPAEMVQTLADGSMDVHVHWTIDDWVERTILSYGDSATVLSPGWLRDRIRDLAGRIAEKYGSTAAE